MLCRCFFHLCTCCKRAVGLSRPTLPYFLSVDFSSLFYRKLCVPRMDVVLPPMHHATDVCYLPTPPATCLVLCSDEHASDTGSMMELGAVACDSTNVLVALATTSPRITKEPQNN